MNYDDMPAGMAMNKLVAMNVMGWHEWDGWDDYDGPYPMFSGWPDIDGVAVYEEGDDNYDRWFNPSTSIADAWQVLEALEGEALDRFHDLMGDKCAMNDLWDMVSIEAAVLICRVALEAVS